MSTASLQRRAKKKTSGMLLTFLCSFWRTFRVSFLQVVQKRMIALARTWTVLWWPVVLGIFVPKIIKICQSFLKLQMIMQVGVVYFGPSCRSCNEIAQLKCRTCLVTSAFLNSYFSVFRLSSFKLCQVESRVSSFNPHSIVLIEYLRIVAT